VLGLLGAEFSTWATRDLEGGNLP